MGRDPNEPGTNLQEWRTPDSLAISSSMFNIMPASLDYVTEVK
jgi:hypothetical protein